MIPNTKENQRARDIIFNSLVNANFSFVKNWVLTLENKISELQDKPSRRNKEIKEKK